MQATLAAAGVAAVPGHCTPVRNNALHRLFLPAGQIFPIVAGGPNPALSGQIAALLRNLCNQLKGGAAPAPQPRAMVSWAMGARAARAIITELGSDTWINNVQYVPAVTKHVGQATTVVIDENIARGPGATVAQVAARVNAAGIDMGR